MAKTDDVVPLADVLAWARPQELPIIVFPGCGHFFHGRLPQLQRVITGMWQAPMTSSIAAAAIDDSATLPADLSLDVVLRSRFCARNTARPRSCEA